VSIATTLVYDATSTSYSHLPSGQHAGYTTGSGGIAWTAAQWAGSPGAVRIDQDYQAVDHTADVLDVENGAATPADCPVWAKACLANYRAAVRPGQRSPAIYVNGSNLSAVVNSLIAGGVTSGIGIFLADWNLNAVQAAARVVAGSGPFPVIGIQFSDAGLYDISVFSVPWLDTISGGGVAVTDPTISAGASGPAVVSAQGRLNVWGASPQLTADGQFGPATTTATAAFQKSHGLASDGVIGPATWAVLNGTPPAVAFQASPPPGIWKAGTVLTLTGTGSGGGTWKTATGDGLHWTPTVAAAAALPAVTLATVAWSCVNTAPGWWQEGSALQASGTGTDGHIWRATTTNGKTWGTLAIWTPPVVPSYSVTAAPPGSWKIGTPLTMTGLAPDGTAWETTTVDGKTWTATVKE
jgi:peptidoglycan hydrolase-like protein with peptidoglycan-binding domain